MKKIILIALTTFMITSCELNNEKSDAYGNFEATEIMASAQASGQLIVFEVDEGKSLENNQLVGLIDTTLFSIKKKQISAKKKSISTQTDNILAQIETLEEQKKTVLINKERIEKLFKDGAATQKQVDDIEGQLSVINKQIKAINTQNASVLSEVLAMNKQIDELNYYIEKCKVINSNKGVVLTKFAEASEIVAQGMPLYSIADLEELTLKVYIDALQLSEIKLGDKVEVLVDKTKDKNKKYNGIIYWISPQAEFTPKIIQTKNERVSLVYAVKIKVKNDGYLKIGMPGEVNFLNKKVSE
jgi:HlyD family secretion protein